MSKFKDDIAEKLFEHLDRTLPKEVKALLTPTLASEFIKHSADFVLIERFNSIFDQAIGLQKALLKSQEENDTEVEDDCFITALKNL